MCHREDFYLSLIQDLEIEYNKVEMNIEEFIVAVYRQHEIEKDQDIAVSGFKNKKPEFFVVLDYLDNRQNFIRKVIMDDTSLSGVPLFTKLNMYIAKLNNLVKN